MDNHLIARMYNPFEKEEKKKKNETGNIINHSKIYLYAVKERIRKIGKKTPTNNLKNTKVMIIDEINTFISNQDR